METLNQMFGRIREDGNIDVLDVVDGIAIRRFDESVTPTVYPVESTMSAYNEHINGIVLTPADAEKIGLEIE